MSDTVVIKLGGNLVDDPMARVVADDLRAMVGEGTRVVVVHGAGPQTSALQRQLGAEPRKVSGRRITDEATLDALKMAAGRLNVNLCALLTAAGLSPVGLHGASSALVEAVRRPPKVILGGPPDPVDLGLVGDVVSVNRTLFTLLLDGGFTPVVACLGGSRTGDVFNVNADVMANRLAVELGADALVLAARDVAGVMRDPDDAATRIDRIDMKHAHELVDQKVIVGGMVAKIEESFAAIQAGVKRVHIVGRLTPGDLQHELATPGSRGTVLVER